MGPLFLLVLSESNHYIEQRVQLAKTQRQLQADPSLSKRVDLVVPVIYTQNSGYQDSCELNDGE
jgi:hypothetical protein